MGQRYFDSHYRFLIETAKAAELMIEYREMKEVGNTFAIEVNGRRRSSISRTTRRCDREILGPLFQVPLFSGSPFWGRQRVSLSPISFNSWNQFFSLRQEIAYRAQGIILNCQAPGGDAMERRESVRSMIQRKYGNLADVSLTDQVSFWRKISGCAVAIFVPGARIDILDRGQIQFMAFGACTISPALDSTLPFMRPVQAGVHYLRCADDFSILLTVVDWALGHKDECLEVGANAARLFSETCLPWKIWRWIGECLDKTK